jgi:hypothetical protein
MTMTEEDLSTSAPAEQQSQQPGRSRRKWVLWGGGLAVLAAVSVALILTLPRGREPGSIPRPETARLAALGPQVAELVALLERGELTRYHARYRAITPEGQPAGTSMSIELWRSPPRIRQDVTVTAGGQTATSSAFLLPSGGVGCTREGTAVAWTCTSIPKDQTTATDSLARQITQQTEAGPVTVRNTRVAGLAVRCFNLPLSETTAEVCVTADGIPALINSGGTRIELVSLAKSVPASVFTPPVQGG